ncbi:MAG: hypothetical protein Q4D56_06370 [Bacteroides sp.]|nr:hypothetical protein [Bacteroides sp.]
MKTFRYLAFIFCVLLLNSCSDDNKDVYKEARESMAISTQIGIYQEGKSVFSFDKSQHQYYFSPSDFIIRFTDMEGSSYTTIQLDALPTEETKANATVTSDMGISIDNISQLYRLKSTTDLVWYWSDENGIGVVVPNTGL